MDTVELFLAGAATIRDAIADPSVAAAWDAPSVLEEQTVGSLAGHLARGGVWQVGEYLAAGVPSGPPVCTTAAAYYDRILGAATEADHQAIRDRGAAVAAVGPAALLAAVDERLAALAAHLPTVEASQLLTVAGGIVMPLGPYLGTRVVEQVVHLDDLARSLDRDPWPVADDAIEYVAHVAFDLIARRRGPHAVIRALYRDGFAEQVLPVF